MKKLILSLTALTFTLHGFSFCGFYVAKADTKLFNKTSQVILVRDGEKSTITMSSDFEGDVKDFAMVVPVPVVLGQNDIRVVDRLVFDKLDAYSSPRLVEYWDTDPCYTYTDYDYDLAPRAAMAEEKMVMDDSSVVTNSKYKVTIEAKYTVGEYDILILSAKESGGLEAWLTDNGYQIPTGAKEVLEPYIKSNMKFFVAKVNLGAYTNAGAVPLRPIQVTFNSPKFMLPIRLGMANSNGDQDMIVYAFSKTGRIETTNYRTVEVPTDMKVPLFVQGEFGEFYRDLFNRTYRREEKNVVFLEYAWDISANVTQYCDPCVGPPPELQEFQDAGVDWVSQYHYGYSGTVYFTRLHVKYNRENFPQDLMFQETPNTTNWQARYVLTHPASGDFSCDAGQTYLQDLNKRRWDELYTYQWLSGRDISSHLDYPVEFDHFLKKKNRGEIDAPTFHYRGGKPGAGNMLAGLLSIFTLGIIFFVMSRERKVAVA